MAANSGSHRRRDSQRDDLSRRNCLAGEGLPLQVGFLLRMCDRYGNAVMPSLVVLTEQREWMSIDGKRGGMCAIAHSGGDSGNLLRFIRIGRGSVTCHSMCMGL